MWTFDTKAGAILTPTKFPLGPAYSGNGQGLNNPLMDGVPGVGPIPAGQWQIGEFFDDIGGKGPQVCHLTPAPGTDTLGRSGFMIHGDNQLMNHSASEGCIIAARFIRDAIAHSGDKIIEVV
jgi:hypothetical protein